MGQIEITSRRWVPRSQRYRWRLRTMNGRIVATSGEGYSDRGTCETMARRIVDGVYRGSVIVREGG